MANPIPRMSSEGPLPKRSIGGRELESQARGGGVESSKVVALIRSYQRWAPASVRGSCRFTPTCSEYTILSIQKYGVTKGVARGLRRVFRCRPPNEGIDEP
jgi:putative membrane protein insertion efficiency factor